MSWTILKAPEQIVGGSYDGTMWKWRLRHKTGHERLLTFQVTGTALAMADVALPHRGSLARSSAGRSEIEQILWWDTPPERIELGALGIRRLGGAEQLSP